MTLSSFSFSSFCITCLLVNGYVDNCIDSTCPKAFTAGVQCITTTFGDKLY
jgi:hypothetical protein